MLLRQLLQPLPPIKVSYIAYHVYEMMWNYCIVPMKTRKQDDKEYKGKSDSEHVMMTL